VPYRPGLAVAPSLSYRPATQMAAWYMQRQWGACGAAVRAFCRTDAIDEAFCTVVEPFYVIAAFNALTSHCAGPVSKTHIWNESLRLKHTYRLPAHIAELIIDLYARGRIVPPCVPLLECSFAKLTERLLQASAALALAFVTATPIMHGEADAILRRAFSYIRPVGIVLADQPRLGGAYNPDDPAKDYGGHPNLQDHTRPPDVYVPSPPNSLRTPHCWQYNANPPLRTRGAPCDTQPLAPGILNAMQFELLRQAVNTVNGMSV
jgi:hypothetical protein